MADISIVISGNASDAQKVIEELQKALANLQTEQKQANTEQKKAGGILDELISKAKGVAVAYASFAAITGFFKDIVGATVEAEQAQFKLEGMIKATGMAAGRTANQISAMAENMANSTLFDDEQIKEAAASLMTFRSIRKATFDETLKVAADVAALKGQDIRGIAFQLGRALENPLQSMRMLRMMGISLLPVEREQIQVMVATGRQADAQRLILDKVTAAFGGGAEGMNRGLSGAIIQAKKQWKEFLEGLGTTAPFSLVLSFLREMETFFRNRVLASNPLEKLNVDLGYAMDRTASLDRQIRRLQEGGQGTLFATTRIAALQQERLDNERLIVAPLEAERQLLGALERQEAATAEAASDASAATAASAAARARAAEAARAALEEQQKQFEQMAADMQQSIHDMFEQMRREAAEDSTTVQSMRAANLREMGQILPAMAIEIEQEYGALWARLTRDGNIAGREIVDATINLRYWRQRQDALKEQLDMHRTLAEAAGRPQIVAEIDIEQQFAPMRAKYVEAGDQMGIELVDRMINLTRARARLAELGTEFERSQQEITARLQEIQIQQQQGLLTPDQAAGQMRQVYTDATTALEDHIAALEQYNADLDRTGDASQEVADKIVALRAQLGQMKASLASVQTTMDRLIQQAAVQWRQSVTSILEGFLIAADVSGNAWEKMARDIVNALKQIAAQMMATYLVQKLLGDPKSAGGRGILSWVFGAEGGYVEPRMVKAATTVPGFVDGGFVEVQPVVMRRMSLVPRMAIGGIVSGPGTGTSDSVPARLSAGEYVVKADRVQAVGVEFLNMLNYGAVPAVKARRGAGFADGGLVTAPSLGKAAQSLFQTNVRIDAQSLDPRVHRQLLEEQAPVFFRMFTRFVRESRQFKEVMRNG